MPDPNLSFESYLARLSPLPTELAKGRAHNASVRSCLRKNFGCFRLFETGSIFNNTGVRHFSDTDYFAVIPKENLRANSANQLRELKDALKYTFWRTAQNIRVSSPAVLIPFGKYRSESLEVTPCFFHKIVDTPSGDKQSFGIPNGDGQWMLSSPKAHKAFVAYHDERLRGRLRPLIKLIKAWKFEKGVPISSFYLELRITKLFASRQRINYSLDVFSVLNSLLKEELARVQDPMRISGYVRACSTEQKRQEAMSKLETAYVRASKACYYRDRSFYEALHWWQMLFGPAFPRK